MKKKLLCVLAISQIAFQSAYGQIKKTSNCGTTGCATGSINISTGFNSFTSAYQNIGEVDANWTLKGAPSNVGITLPSPTWVIFPNPSWIRPIAKWVSPFRTWNFDENNVAPDPPFEFERCFCLCQPGMVNIQFYLYADDYADAYLDGVQIATPPINSGNQFQLSGRIVYNQTLTLAAGQHCLSVRLRNNAFTAMGFALEGEISGSNLISSGCCNPMGKICGAKISDIGRDGVHSVDPGLKGWTIELKDALGSIITTKVTDSLGNYCFDSLNAGTYLVSEVNKPGWTQTYPSGSGVHSITLAPGGTATAYFANHYVLEICGKKIIDINCNKDVEEEDIGIENWGIVLSDQFGGFLASTITDPDGNYCFTALEHGLAAGNTYQVSEVNQPGWAQLVPSSPYYTVVAQPGGNYGVNFINCSSEGRGKICGKKFLDSNNNGIADGVYDVGLPGWQIVLSDSYGNPIDTIVTDGNGNYCFDSLEAGITYQVAEVNKSGWVQSYPINPFHIVFTRIGGNTNINFGNAPSNIGPCDFGIDFDIQKILCAAFFNLKVNSNPFNLPITSIEWDFGSGRFQSGSLSPFSEYNAGDYTVCVDVVFQRGDITCSKRVCKPISFVEPCIIPDTTVVINPDPDRPGSQSNISTNADELGNQTKSQNEVVLLNQNVPNPFNERTTISYSLPMDCKKAKIIIKNKDGELIKEHNLNTNEKQGKLTILGRDIANGTYFYTLVVDGRVAAFKQLVKE